MKSTFSELKRLHILHLENINGYRDILRQQFLMDINLNRLKCSDFVVHCKSIVLNVLQNLVLISQYAFDIYLF